MHKPLSPILAALALAALALATVAQPSFAQPPGSNNAMSEAAEELYDQATEARRAKQWERCYAKAKAAEAIDVTPNIVALVGDCAVGAQHYADGANHLADYLAGDLSGSTPELQDYLKQRLATARQHVATVTIESNAPATQCEVDDTPVRRLPITIHLEPGDHTFTGEAKGTTTTSAA